MQFSVCLLALVADFDELLTKILAGQEPQKRLERVLQALDDAIEGFQGTVTIPTLALTCRRKPQRGTREGWKRSGAVLGQVSGRGPAQRVFAPHISASDLYTASVPLGAPALVSYR